MSMTSLCYLQYIIFLVKFGQSFMSTNYYIVTYHSTSTPFPFSSGADYTLFQSPINLRTKPFIPHQSHRVLNNNFYSV